MFQPYSCVGRFLHSSHKTHKDVVHLEQHGKFGHLCKRITTFINSEIYKQIYKQITFTA